MQWRRPTWRSTRFFRASGNTRCVRKSWRLPPEQARAVLASRHNRLSEEQLAAYAEEMSGFLLESELTESRAFIRSFVKEIRVSPGKAVIHYTMPTPPDSPIRGGTAAGVALESPVLPTVTRGRPGRDRTSDRWIKSPLLYR